MEGLRFPMVGAGLESGCWMVWEMVEWRLVASVSELESGCIVAELALRVPKGGRMSVRFASRDSRTIQRIGRDAGNCVAQTERGGFRSSSLGDKLHPCQSIASRLAIARGICARFSASGGRLALSVDFAPAGRGGPMARVSGGAGRGDAEAERP